MSIAKEQKKYRKTCTLKSLYMEQKRYENAFCCSFLALGRHRACYCLTVPPQLTGVQISCTFNLFHVDLTRALVIVHGLSTWR